MTAYPESQLSIVSGLIPQIVLACTYQQICNRKYEARGIKIDFATGSIRQGVAMTDDPKDIPVLRLNISMPIDQQSGLLKKTDLAERIESVTDIDLGNVSVGREVAYIRLNDFPVPAKPVFLRAEFDTLERRIIWMCLQLTNLKSWILEWNQYLTICNTHRAAYSLRNSILAANPSLVPFQPPIASLEHSILEMLITMKTPYILAQSTAISDADRLTDYTTHLIAELSQPLEYHPLLVLENYTFEIPIYPDLTPLTTGSISDAASESSYVDSLGASSGSETNVLDYNDFIRGGESASTFDAPDTAAPVDTLSSC